MALVMIHYEQVPISSVCTFTFTLMCLIIRCTITHGVPWQKDGADSVTLEEVRPDVWACHLSVFFGHFLGGPGLARTRMSPLWILMELRVMEVTTGAIRCAKLQSKCHHQQTNTQFFTGWIALPVSRRCQGTEGKCLGKSEPSNWTSKGTKV